MGLAIESVKASFSILKRHPKILILGLILTAFSSISVLYKASSFIYLSLLPFIMFFSLLYGASIQLVVKDALSSKTVSLRKSLSLGFKKLHKVLGLVLLFILIFGLISIPMIVAMFLPKTISYIWVFIIFLIVTSAGLMYISIKLIFAMPILMIENSGIVESLKRSWTVSKNKFWSIVGASGLLYLLYIPYFMAVLIFVFISLFLPTSFLLIKFLVSVALSFVPSTLISFLPAAYYLKMKRERK